MFCKDKERLTYLTKRRLSVNCFKKTGNSCQLRDLNTLSFYNLMFLYIVNYDKTSHTHLHLHTHLPFKKNKLYHTSIYDVKNHMVKKPSFVDLYILQSSFQIYL